ncbi:MAG: hypothetical protein C4516_04895 [Oxalobacter sp.]|nr:MAG: hypothetical protein C4516_04895 [Oxalobacter sp.]
MRFYIPEKLPEDFLLSRGYQPVEKVFVQPLQGGMQMSCLDNVRKYLANNGGDFQFGWVFSMFGKFILKLHAHVVVRLDKDDLLCVTPPEQTTRFINFSRDNSIPSAMVNDRLPTISFALVDAPIIHQLVQIENDEDSARLRGDIPATKRIQAQRNWLADEFVTFAKANTGRNEICYCGSTRKYKFCCAR